MIMNARTAKLFTFALLAAAPLAAQESREKPASGSGLAVPERPMFMKAASRARIEDPAGEDLGEVHDYVLDTRTGRIVSLALRAEGSKQPVLVPYERLSWNAEERRLVLSMSASELEALPAYVRDGSRPVGRVGAGATGGNGGPREPGAVKAHDLLSSEALKCQVGCLGGDSLGSVAELVLEPRSGAVAFVLVDAKDGPSYVVPWRAMTWNPPSEEGDDGSLVVNKTADELTEAPRLDSKDVAPLESDEAVKSIHDFYALSIPTRG